MVRNVKKNIFTKIFFSRSSQVKTLKPYISGTVQATEMILTSFERYDPKVSKMVQQYIVPSLVREI